MQNSPYLDRPIRTIEQAQADIARSVYRVYADGREFGIDYSTLEAAQAAKRAYEPHFPRTRYYIRKIR